MKRQLSRSIPTMRPPSNSTVNSRRIWTSSVCYQGNLPPTPSSSAVLNWPTTSSVGSAEWVVGSGCPAAPPGQASLHPHCHAGTDIPGRAADSHRTAPQARLRLWLQGGPHFPTTLRTIGMDLNQPTSTASPSARDRGGSLIPVVYHYPLNTRIYASKPESRSRLVHLFLLHSRLQ